MFFDNVQQGAPDVMYELKLRADGDTNPNKVDLGVGIYRNEQGLYHELRALKDVQLPNTFVLVVKIRRLTT